MKWLTLGLKFGPLLISAIQTIEKLSHGLTGAEKRDAAVDFATAILPAIEGAAGRDLIDDASVQVALRETIDAYVALQNVIARVHAKNAAASASGTGSSMAGAGGD